jgi:murein DD-endopeptidase MepM/ murein hydrolase activator NlpD
VTAHPGIDPADFRECTHAPAEGRIVSGFGTRTSIQEPGTSRHHQGLDIAGSIGDPVYAAADGIVEHATENGAAGFSCYGHVIVVWHPQWDEDRTFYAHLSAMAVSVGERVQSGDRIGSIGNTNGSTRSRGTTFAQGSCSSGRTPPFLTSLRGRSGPHLHFEASPHSYPQRYDAPRYQPARWLADRGVTYDSDGRVAVAASCTHPSEEPTAQLGPSGSRVEARASTRAAGGAAGGVLVPAVAIGAAVGLARRWVHGRT